MHILHVTRTRGSDFRYGLIKSLQPVIDAIRSKGHRVDVLDFDQAQQIPLTRSESLLVKAYLTIIRLRLGCEDSTALHFLRERFEVGVRAARIAARCTATHVHCHDPLLGAIYDFLRKFYHAPANWGMSEHAYGRFVKLRRGITIGERALKILQSMELQATRRARWIIFPTRGGMEQCVADLLLHGPLSTCHVVPHAVPIPSADRTKAREKLGMKQEEKLLIAVGELLPMKRFDVLLDSLALLPCSIMPRVIILGEGPEHQALVQQSHRLNLADQLTITVTDHIGEFFAAADIYVSTSSTEAFGLANCEALASGVPSVLTAVDAVPALAGDAALLVSDAPQEIAGAITSILTSGVVRQTLAARAARLTERWPGPHDIADSMIAIYQASCRKSGP